MTDYTNLPREENRETRIQPPAKGWNSPIKAALWGAMCCSVAALAVNHWKDGDFVRDVSAQSVPDSVS